MRDSYPFLGELARLRPQPVTRGSRVFVLAHCPCRKLKFGNIDDAVRQEQGWRQCGRRDSEVRFCVRIAQQTAYAFGIEINKVVVRRVLAIAAGV